MEEPTARIDAIINAFNILVQKLESNKFVRTSQGRGGNNIKIHSREMDVRLGIELIWQKFWKSGATFQRGNQASESTNGGYFWFY